MPRHIISWQDLLAVEPSAADVARSATQLAAAYNHPHNATLLGHTAELTAQDVIDHYASLQPPHAHGFFLVGDAELVADGDLRGIADGAGEFAFLVVDPRAQGKGLGTRFAIMVHAFAFQTLGLDRVYASVIPANTGSLRVFEKLGYVRDDSTDLGDDGDIVLRIDRATFVEQHARVLSEITIVAR